MSKLITKKELLELEFKYDEKGDFYTHTKYNLKLDICTNDLRFGNFFDSEEFECCELTKTNVLKLIEIANLIGELE